MDGTDVEMEHRLTSVEKLAGSNRHRLDEVEHRMEENDKLVTAVCGLQKDMEHTKSDVGEIKKDVKELTGKSGKRWDAIVEKLVWAVLAAIVAFALAKVGL